MQRNAAYVLAFAGAVCIVCAVVVSSAAVSLEDLQEANANAYRQENVLVAAGLMDVGEELDDAERQALFETIEAHVIDLSTGERLEDVDPTTFDQRKATSDPSRSQAAPPNAAQIPRIPNRALVYEMRDDTGQLELVILPVEGKGLWSTLYGFFALEADLSTVRGITFYEHRETPGLGGEVDNPRWKARWPGREAFDDQRVVIEVIKGSAGPPEEDPYRVDGLSGATITSRGVTNLLHFWLGDNGFDPYLDRLRQEIG